MFRVLLEDFDIGRLEGLSGSAASGAEALSGSLVSSNGVNRPQTRFSLDISSQIPYKLSIVMGVFERANFSFTGKIDHLFKKFFPLGVRKRWGEKDEE